VYINRHRTHFFSQHTGLMFVVSKGAIWRREFDVYERPRMGHCWRLCRVLDV